MKILNMKGIVWIIVIVTMKTINMAEAEVHFVGGGKYSWAANVNFSEWSTHEHFYVGDWLYFGYDKNTYNVLQVNKTSYEKCIETDFISNITRGGRDVFELTEPGLYYFLSGRGFCWQGMKVAIKVVNASRPSPSASPPPSPKSAASGLGFNNNGRIQVLLLISASVLSFFRH